MATTSPARMALLSLPTEIRFIVYDHLIAGDNNVSTHISELETLHIIGFDTRALSVRRTCKQLEKEFTKYISGKLQMRLAIQEAVEMYKETIRRNIRSLPTFISLDTQKVELCLDITLHSSGLRHIACLENALRTLATCARLKILEIRIFLHFGSAPQHTYMELTRCHMDTWKEGRKNGWSKAQRQIQYGWRAAEKVKTLLLNSPRQ